AVSRATDRQYFRGRAGNHVPQAARYVYTTKPGGIDSKHVVAAANSRGALTWGGSELGGAVVEFLQIKDFPDSALNRSDFYSNSVGALAAKRYYALTFFTKKSLGHYVQEVLLELGGEP